MSVAELRPYRDKFLIQSDPHGFAVVTDIDSGETLRVNWDTAQHILIDEMFREQKTGGKK
jgi:hypothetical protein